MEGIVIQADERILLPQALNAFCDLRKVGKPCAFGMADRGEKEHGAIGKPWQFASLLIWKPRTMPE